MKYFFLLAFLLPLMTQAQFQSYGNLTIFSEDGDKFYLILNGEKQNEEPQTNMRVEELPQPYYSARILFEDKSLAPITKNNLMITDADGVFMDVTYKIRRDKTNKPKLNYFSMIPVQQNFMPPSGMYVRHFGQPSPQSGGVRQTTTTTTTTNTMGAQVNLPGVNMNVTISDPTLAQTTTTQTTVIHHDDDPPVQPAPRGCSGSRAMSSTDFSAAKNTIDESSFDETKLSTAKSIVSSNCLTSDQIVQVCQMFSFEDNKLDFAKFAYRYCTDPRNYFKVNNVFSFSTSKEALNRHISGQ